MPAEKSLLGHLENAEDNSLFYNALEGGGRRDVEVATSLEAARPEQLKAFRLKWVEVPKEERVV